jgi:hypothetical protein
VLVLARIEPDRAHQEIDLVLADLNLNHDPVGAAPLTKPALALGAAGAAAIGDSVKHL